MNNFKKSRAYSTSGFVSCSISSCWRINCYRWCKHHLQNMVMLQAQQTHLVEVSVQTKTLPLTGSGELDNGTTFTVFTATTDTQGDLTSGYISIATPSFGSFLMGHHSGAAHYKYDEEVPQVYEQVSDITSTVTQNKVGDFMDNNHITYTSPTFELVEHQ